MARPRGIKQRHPLGSVASRTGVSPLTVVAVSSASTGVKISELPVALAASDTDQMEVNQGGVSKRLTLEQLTTLAIGGIDLSTLATKTGTLTAGNVAVLTATGIADSGVVLLSSLPATTIWGNNTTSTAAPSALTVLTLANGTAAAPIYSFNASASTGIYSSGANQLALAANGRLCFQLRSADATSYLEYIYSGGVMLRAQGATNIDANFVANGTGHVYLQSNGGGSNGVLLRATPGTAAGTASNYLQIITGAATANVRFKPIAQGTGDTNIGFDFEPLGTGTVRNISTFFHARSGQAVAAGVATQAFVKGSSVTNLGLYYGTGDPTFSAGQGSLYVKTDASTTTTRLWVNTTGSTTWANVTASA